MKIAAVLVAAGRGARAGGGTPKQYRLLAGLPLLRWSLEAFACHPRIGRILVAIHPDDAAAFEATAQGLSAPIETVAGGATRTDSVRACLAALALDPPDAVLIHDAARPCVSAGLIDAVVDALGSAEGAVPALAIADALLRADAEGRVTAAADRTGLHRAQTPQGFRFADLARAYAALPPGTALADDAAVALGAGLTVALVPGDPANEKITLPEDFARTEARLAPPGRMSVGFGYDVHRLSSGAAITLCGVRIEEGLALIGHSDADAGLHALTDAILGAAGEGDIGQHFPPSDPQWRGAASDRFLAHALDLAARKGGRITHADITFICERPRIGPYRDAMRARLGALLRLPPGQVSVKATTTEGLGFTGRGEGLAAQAVATVSW